MISSQNRIYGLIGYPVKHSLSPLMHNAAFRALKINAEYQLFELKDYELSSFLKELSRKNIFGLNVTIPYKEKIISELEPSNISKEALIIGAVNTIKVSDKGLEGFNTDGEGFLRDLDESLKFNPLDKTISVIGAGGAAKAISVCLSRKKPKAIYIYDVDTAKASDLYGHLVDNFKETKFVCAHDIKLLPIEESDLLINATPIGMKESDPCLVDQKSLNKDILVYDLIYNPEQTKLLKLAREKGARAANGLGMLLYQGARSFEIWTGKPAPVEIMRRALKEGAKSI